MPYQALISTPGTPASAIVGTSGSWALRLALSTASARTLPLLMCGITDDAVSNAICTCPPIRSTMAGPLPRYGMCVIRTPVASLNSSAAMCCVLPEPLLAKL
ncbi:hypothetical protein D3C72_1954580 [compost metagenome]